MHLRLIRLAWNSRLPLLTGVACGVVAGLSSLVQAYTLSATVDGVFLGRQGLAHVWPWLRLMLAVIVARGLLLCLQEIAANEVAIRVKHELRTALFAHILRLGPAFSRGEHAGELTATAVEGIEALDGYFSQYLPQLAVSVLVPITILLVVFPIDPLSGLILLLTAPLIPFFMYMIGRTAELATTRQYETLGRLSSQLLDSLQGLTTLKLFGQSAAQVKNIARAADQFRAITLEVLQVSFLSAFALELLATISTAIIAVEVGLRLLHGHLEFRPAIFLLILAPEFYLPLRMLGMRFHAGMAGTAAARRIFTILDARAAPEEALEYAGDTLQRNHEVRSPAIELCKVSYTYPAREQPALTHIDFAIEPGERVALVGPSGSGKTTLAGLLLGFMLPTSGGILFDGRPRASASGADRNALIGWVPQAPHLLHDSIAANIRLGKPDASDEEVFRAARLAHLDEFIESLPDGYEARVGEGGARLSSGEAQRLALARAFILDAPILLLDEPSSSLDPENEALLDDSLTNLQAGRTVLTITHRLNTAVAADRILVLDRGRIVEQGTHTALLAKGGSYAALVKAASAGSGDLAASLRGNEPASTAVRTAAAPNTFGPVPQTPLPIIEAAPADLRQTWQLLVGFLKGSWRWVAVSVLLGSLTIGSSVALMGTSAWLISAAALHPSIASLQLAIVGVRLFGISRAVFRYLERLVSHGVTFRLLRNIRVWFYSRLEPLAPARLMDFQAGDLIARAMADVDTLENVYVRVLAPPLTAVCVATATCSFLVMHRAAGAAAIVAAMFLLAGVAVPLSAQRFARHLGHRMIGERADLHAQLVDGIQGLADILAFGRAGDRLGRLQTTSATHAASQRRMARVGGLHSGMSSILINSALWLTLLFTIPAVNAGLIDVLMLAPLALIVLAAFEAVAALPGAGQMWPAIEAAASRLIEVVSARPLIATSSEPRFSNARAVEDGSSTSLPGCSPEVAMRRVSFAYPGRLIPSLREVSLRIEPGRCLGVVGPSGAGKSTIANLLLRFWEYDSGEIHFGGSPIRALEPERVRSQIGYLSQHPYLFDTSIYENLRLARRGASRADVENAASRARIHDFIIGLPQGYDTLIGEHGARLSAGERQRLGVARLLLKNAPLLILDEPTANLDALTEQDVLSTLFALRASKTALLITHRLVGMERLDEIVVMDHGQIVQRGTHSSLLAGGGLYGRLWRLQSRQSALPPGPLAGTG